MATTPYEIMIERLRDLYQTVLSHGEHEYADRLRAALGAGGEVIYPSGGVRVYGPDTTPRGNR